MKPMKYTTLKLRNRKRFRPGHPIHTVESRALSTLGQVVLVLVGGFLGIVGNQWFFADNKKVELQQQMAKEKMPYYTRIVNFTDNYKETILSNITTQYDIKKTTNYDLSLKLDTTYIKSDTIRYQLPSFVVDTIARKDFLSDLNEIKTNKDKLDSDVWSKFQDLLVFLDNHPLPTIANHRVITNWTNKKVLQEWGQILSNLHDVTEEKINNPF